MKTQPLYRYLTLAALISIWSCSSSRQTAQNTSESDDLYGIANNSEIYASNQDSYSDSQLSRRQQRYERQQQRSRNDNPDYNDEQNYSANTDEYYTELSARKLNRGISPDPGWGDDNSYNSGFVNGYNAATASAYSWNRWGFNNTGFYNGLGLGLGMSAFSPGFGIGFGSPFYSPYGYGNAFAYNSFYSPYGYGGFGGWGYNDFYSPFYSPYSYYGYGGWGGWGGRPVYVNNVYVAGADPYRNRSYVRSNDRSAGRYANGFDNSPRTYNPNGGRRSADYNGSTSPATSGSDGYYARPSTSSRGSSRGSSYYYDNGSGATSSGGRAGNAVSAPSYNSNSGSGDYYARPRQSSRGSFSPSESGRSSITPQRYQQSQPSFQQPSQSSRSFQQPSYSAPSQPSFSAPSSGGGGRSFGGGGGGGGRGPR
ncbi:hypothetical protein GCM10028807_16620 [Spirosoma daeguense]